MSQDETSEPTEEIPWEAPVAANEPADSEHVPATQIVGYEFGQPVELQAPRFDDPAGEDVAPSRIAAGHSVLEER